MRRGAKMMMISGGNGNRDGNMEARSEMYGYSEMNGGNTGMESMEARRRYRRDSRGRFRSEMEAGSGYGEMEGAYGEMENRRRYARSEMEGNEMRGGRYPFPVYEDGGSSMNLIGFNPNREVETNYRMNATHHSGNEMEHKGGERMHGKAHSSMTMPLTKEMAEMWMRNMKSEDGNKGPYWSLADAKNIMEQRGFQCDPYEFAAVLNAIHSDYSKTLKKHGVESLDLYADLAYAWLKDSDAMPNKAFLYYDCIVKK